ncbi:hypothetical protein ARMSODRAFT_562120 [Armillaria solidipes]|uniref:Uncharacterized protein n=1 Tax=Armillaria solidipes TaxID=1076256 RepID=A0A2H3BDY9_9AGAR|nr:hypothetical protein ARMSODRAFT_562120 [Armillaria solidipes]
MPPSIRRAHRTGHQYSALLYLAIHPCHPRLSLFDLLLPSCSQSRTRSRWALFKGCPSERTRFSQVKESDVRHHLFVQRAGIHDIPYIFIKKRTKSVRCNRYCHARFRSPVPCGPFHVPLSSLGTRHLHLLTHAGKLDDR